MKARFSGLPAGAHGFHVHLLGDCRGEGKRAGTHFNFSGPSRNPPEDIDRITGNLGILESGEDGQAQLEADIDDARLHGPYSILGRSIIVHARANDPKQPPIGAAGARIACGVIGLTEG
jgi:Cu-Zn family superoxide dismutase